MSARYVQPLRILIQFCFLGFMLWLGVRFYQFVHHFRSNGEAPFVPRPEGIEGFLPISGLLGLSAWIKGLGINDIHPAAVVIFVTVLVLALLLRRSFCSWICPVAAVSECAWKSGFKLLRRNPRLPRWLDVPLRGVKYLLMAFFVYSVAFAMSPADMEGFIRSDYHRIADVRLLDFFRHLSPLALGIILFLLAASLLLRNPFCRYLCPYGALLGLVADAVAGPRDAQHRSAAFPAGSAARSARPTSMSCTKAERLLAGMHRLLALRQPLPFQPGAFHAGCRRDMPCRGSSCPAGGESLLGGTLVGRARGHWQTALDTGEYRRLLGQTGMPSRRIPLSSHGR